MNGRKPKPGQFDADLFKRVRGYMGNPGRAGADRVLTPTMTTEYLELVHERMKDEMRLSQQQLERVKALTEQKLAGTEERLAECERDRTRLRRQVLIARTVEDGLRIDRVQAKREVAKLAAAPDSRPFKPPTCAICFQPPINRFLRPCGHTLCSTCCDRLRGQPCPFCKVPIASAVPMFLTTAE